MKMLKLHQKRTVVGIFVGNLFYYSSLILATGNCPTISSSLILFWVMA
jgi:hypothetical protein